MNFLMRLALAIGTYVFGFIICLISGIIYASKQEKAPDYEPFDESRDILARSIVWPMVLVCYIFIILPVKIISVIIKKLRK